MTGFADIAGGWPLVAVATGLAGSLLALALQAAGLRRARAKLRRLEASRRILESQNAALAAASAEAEARMMAIAQTQSDMMRRARASQLGQLVATVAHEMRNPLGSLRISAYLLKRKLPQNPDHLSLIDRMDSGINRCDSIITQLLDYSSEAKPNLAVDDFHAWISNLLEEQASRLAPAITLRLVMEEGELEASFDHLRLRRALINLISNAEDALTGSVLAATRAPVIEVEVKPSWRGLEIAISDNGPGIPADILDRVGEPLFTTKSFGTGLGVASARKAAELHGGALELASSPEGTRACLWFPRAEAQAIAA